MREILFRGICTETKQWVFGSKYNDFIISYLEVDKFLKESDLFQCNCVIRDVVPETIGQFTGLLDKNGVKIFEGDKFKPDESIEEVTCIVRWDDEFSKFVVDSYGYNFHIGEGSQEVYDNELSIVDTYDLADMILEYCEIIGNIHDHATL